MLKLTLTSLLLLTSNYLYAIENKNINVSFYTDSQTNWFGEIYSNGASISHPSHSVFDGDYLLREEFKLNINKKNPFLILRVFPEESNLGIICSEHTIHIYSTTEIEPCTPFNTGNEQFTAYISRTPININVFARLYAEAELEIINDGTEYIEGIYEELRNNLSHSDNEREIITEIFEWTKYNINYEVRRGVDTTWKSIESILNSRTADCKGMAIIIRSLLKKFGIESKTVFSSSQQTENKINNTILNGYDHVIVYVPKAEMFLDATNKELLAGEVSDYTIGQELYVIQDDRFEDFRKLNGMKYFYKQSTTIEEIGEILHFELSARSFGKRILSIDLEKVVDQGLLEHYISLFLEVPEDIVTAKNYDYSEKDIRELKVSYSIAVNDIQEFINDSGTFLTFQRFPSSDVNLSISHGEIAVKDCDPLVQADYFIFDHTSRYDPSGLIERDQSISSVEKGKNSYGIRIPGHVSQSECMDVDYFNARHDAVADLYSIRRLTF